MHQGHRERMRQRIEKSGLVGLADHEVLEYLLYFVHKRSDTNGIAHNLIEHFHSLDKVFDADEDALMEVSGVGLVTAQFLSILPELFGRYDRSRKEDGVRFVSLGRIVEWLQGAYYGAGSERAVLLCLDADFNLIHEKVWQGSSATEAAISVREVVATCLKFDASKAVFSHNHLTNINKPSMEDMLMTNELKAALNNVSVALIDHIIICSNGSYYSFKTEKRL